MVDFQCGCLLNFGACTPCNCLEVSIPFHVETCFSLQDQPSENSGEILCHPKKPLFILWMGSVSPSRKKIRGPRSQGSSEAPGGDKNGPASKQDGRIRCRLRFDMEVSENRGTPQIIHFNRVFHHKPSILGVPLFLETPIY